MTIYIHKSQQFVPVIQSNIKYTIKNAAKNIYMYNELFIQNIFHQGIYFEQLNVELCDRMKLFQTMNIPLEDYIIITIDKNSPFIEDLSMFKYSLEDEMNEIIKQGGKNKQIQQLIDIQSKEFIKNNQYTTLYNSLYNETYENIGYLETTIKYNQE